MFLTMYVPTKTFRKMWRKVNFFKTSGLNSEFSFYYDGCHTKITEPSQPYY